MDLKEIHDLPLSLEKCDKFYELSADIIKNGLIKYDIIRNKSEYIFDENDASYFITGVEKMTNVFPFLDIDDDENFIDKFTFFPKNIISNIGQAYIYDGFNIRRTGRYLLNPGDLIRGIKTIIGNKKDVVIVGVNLSDKTYTNIKPFHDILLAIDEIKGYEDVLFILERKNLPFFNYKEISRDEKLKLIDNEFKIYGLVLKLTKEQIRLFKRPLFDYDDFNKVSVTFDYLINLVHKRNCEIIRIDITSIYKEQGISDDLKYVNKLK